MKKILFILAIASALVFNTQVVLARGTSHGSTSHSSPHISTPHPSTSHTTPHNSSTSQSSHVGTSRLHSRTPVPKPHTYDGRKYNSSAAQYTNTDGYWVWYWMMVPNGPKSKSKHIECFDKDHKRVTCNRDSKSYQKDW